MKKTLMIVVALLVGGVGGAITSTAWANADRSAEPQVAECTQQYTCYCNNDGCTGSCPEGKSCGRLHNMNCGCK